MSTGGSTIDFDTLKRLVFEVVGQRVIGIDQRNRDGIRRTFEVTLESRNVILCYLLEPHVPDYLINSEVATMQYVRDYIPIPVPRTLAYGTDDSLGSFLFVEKALGMPLDVVFPSLTSSEQDVLVAQIAKWAVLLFRHRFGSIGSLYANSEDGFMVGRVVKPSFFSEGRAHLPIDRGPFASAKDYLLACAQREIDCARTLVSQDASVAYQQDVEDCRLQVEQIMSLMADLIQKSKGLDDDDPELAPFSLDFHEHGLKNFIVSDTTPRRIVSVTGWDCMTTMPLWQCARLPRWLQTTLSDGDDDNAKVRLSAIFRHVVRNEDGQDSLFLRALDNEGSTRCSLQDLSDYNAFKDGFLLRPTLESMSATLPGEEDMEGLSAILDPTTVTGRVARISLMTTGSAGDAMALAFADKGLQTSRPYTKRDFFPHSAVEEKTSSLA